MADQHGHKADHAALSCQVRQDRNRIYNQVISLFGLGLKLPTGNFHERAQYANFTGNPLTRSNKPIPLTIMPGDGGVDVLVELLGYRSVNYPIKRSQVFGYGNYLITPRSSTH